MEMDHWLAAATVFQNFAKYRWLLKFFYFETQQWIFNDVIMKEGITI